VTSRHGITILLSDDDEDDLQMTLEALHESRLGNNIETTHDGEELMDYLFRRGRFADPADSPTPGLIMLDLNMPKKDGREALAEIKADPELRTIPVIVLTTSQAEEDILRSYNLHANAYVAKPVDFERFIDVIRQIDDFFVTVVKLPR
jgi:CheY-like chemotaxis protein